MKLFDDLGNLIAESDNVELTSNGCFKIGSHEYCGGYRLGGYKLLSKVEFIDHVMEYSKFDDNSLTISYNDGHLYGFWLRFELSEKLAKDHKSVIAGLTALENLGYITQEEHQAILDNWPEE